MRKIHEIMDKFVKIIIVLLTILFVYWWFQLMFGHSPSISQINSILLITIAGFFVKLYREVGEIKIENKYNFTGIKNGFNKIKEDTKGMKQDMFLIKKKLKV